MDDEYRDIDTFSHGGGTVYSIWNYIQHWLLRPIFRGILFGFGHFTAVMIIGPYLKELFLTKE